MDALIIANSLSGGLALIQIARNLQALRKIADLARRADIGQKRLDILLVVQKAKCVDQLLDIRLVKHVLDIHRSPPNPPKGIEVDTDIGHRYTRSMQ